MKLLIALLISSCSSLLLSGTMGGGSQKTFYFFCESHAWSPANGFQKQFALYTKVQTITCEEEMIPEKTKEWSAYVKANCKNENGCTSDLNYYPTKEAADKRYSNLVNKLSDSTKYSAVMADFK